MITNRVVLRNIRVHCAIYKLNEPKASSWLPSNPDRFEHSQVAQQSSWQVVVKHSIPCLPAACRTCNEGTKFKTNKTGRGLAQTGRQTACAHSKFVYKCLDASAILIISLIEIAI